MQHIFPKSLNKEAFPTDVLFSLNLAQRECAVIAPLGLQDTQFTTRAYGSGLTLSFFSNLLQKSSHMRDIIDYTALFISNFVFILSFFFTQGQVPNVYTRWQCRLNLTYTFLEKGRFRRRRRFLQKSASLFRGTFCFMRLTDIPLCIRLCLFRVSH